MQPAKDDATLPAGSPDMSNSLNGRQRSPGMAQRGILFSLLVLLSYVRLAMTMS